MALAAFTFAACSSSDNDPLEDVNPPAENNPSNGDNSGENNNGNNPSGGDNSDNKDPETPTANSKILVAYFSWSGNTENVAKRIGDLTGGTLYEIEPETPYTTNYTELAYTVARNELDTNARPALKETKADFSSYDYVFIGCPVWWQTAPMIMSTFCETYDFKDKTVIPFCTYASTGRDATLQKLNDLTPNSKHLQGYGGNTSGVEAWLKSINMIKSN